MRKMIFDHVRQYWIIYLTLLCVFLAGSFFGAVGVGALSEEKTIELTKFVDNLLVEQPNTLESAFLQQLARDNIIIMAGIWVLGLTIIGTPLVYLIVFTRGFILGFTIAFIIQIKKIMGIGLAILTIVFPSFVAVPCLLLGAGLATIFSFLLIQGKSSGESVKKEFFYYCAATIVVSFGAVGAGVLQGYFSIVGVNFFGF
ncbi:MAG: stage II sporulation protein M [Eubacteriales bacterium]